MQGSGFHPRGSSITNDRTNYPAQPPKADMDKGRIWRCGGGGKQRMDVEAQKGGACFTLAVTRYKRELHRYLLRRLRRPQDVEDLAQEVFMRLARLNETKDVRNALSYLYGIASNVVADFTAEAQQERQHLSVSSEVVERWVDDPTEVLPDTLAERLDVQRLIERMLAELPTMQAAVLVLHDRDGMSYEEIARETGLSVHTVHKYLVQARSRIRTMKWDR